MKNLTDFVVNKLLKRKRTKGFDFSHLAKTDSVLVQQVLSRGGVEFDNNQQLVRKERKIKEGLIQDHEQIQRILDILNSNNKNWSGYMITTEPIFKASATLYSGNKVLLVLVFYKLSKRTIGLKYKGAYYHTELKPEDSDIFWNLLEYDLTEH